jgi:hypothetical protein
MSKITYNYLCGDSKKRHGITMAEVLAALLILGIGIVGVAQMYVASMITYKKSLTVAIATERAQKELELISKIPYTKIISGHVSSYYVPHSDYLNFQSVSYSENGNIGYKWSYCTPQSELPHDNGINRSNVIIKALQFNGNKNIYKVVININWQGYRGVDQNITLTSLLANKTNTTAPEQPVKPIITVSPPGTKVLVNSRQQFTAAITGGTLNPGTISWRVLEDDGGTITSNGLYTAPNRSGTFDIIATSDADATISTSVAVKVYLNIGTVTINEINPDIDPLTTKQFTATVTNMSPATVAWSVLEPDGGTISSSGLYTAPSMPGTYTIIATSTANPAISNTTSIVVHLLNIEITTPSTLTENLQCNKSITLNVTPAVPCIWTVSGGGSFPDPYLRIYSSPNTTDIQVIITATSISDPTKKATRVFNITSAGYY